MKSLCPPWLPHSCLSKSPPKHDEEQVTPRKTSSVLANLVFFLSGRSPPALLLCLSTLVNPEDTVLGPFQAQLNEHPLGSPARLLQATNDFPGVFPALLTWDRGEIVLPGPWW